MLKSFKSSIKHITYNHPKAIGWFSFFVVLILTMSISFGDYQFRLLIEQQQVEKKLYEIEKSFGVALNEAVSAGKTLGFLAKNDSILDNFNEIGRQILANNPTVDVLQLLDSGVVVANFPSEGNEAVMGYDILQNGPRRVEALESIRENKMIFAGPLDLIQGGTGIIGRMPFFDNGKLSGFSSVIIYMETMLEAVNIQNSPESPFFIQFSKTNPNSGAFEHFLPIPPEHKEYSEIKASTFLGSGKWLINVQLKESNSFWESLPVVLLRILLSIGLGLVAWSFAKQPSILSQKVKEQSKTILDSNERFEYVTKATTDIIWDWDLESDEVFRSDLFYENFGYSNSLEINKAGFWTSIIHPDDIQEVKENMDLKFASNDSYWQHEFRIRKADQTYAYVRDKGYIIRNQEGKASRMIGAIEDITKRKTIELELAKEKEMLENVISGTEAATWEWNVQSGETLINETWAKIIGYKLADLHPLSIENWKNFALPEDRKRIKKALEIHFKGEKAIYESEYRMKHKNGSIVWVFDRGKVSSWTEDGRPLMMFGTHMDITEKKAQEEIILSANQKLKNANEELQVFATLASHDMREPLRMISSFMSLLQKKYGDGLDQKANQYIHFAADGAQRLTYLINDLLEYSKIGYDRDNAEFIDTRKLIEEILPLKNRLIYEKGAKIILENLPNIKAVKTPIKTLFRNIIGNALYFTRDGICPIIKIEGFETEEFWEFSIIDNGLGIEPDKLSYIFGILNKISAQGSHHRTGMGLAIAKKIVNQHGGTICVESTPMEGSKFYFTLKKQ